jgi:hypothetical protein
MLHTAAATPHAAASPLHILDDFRKARGAPLHLRIACAWTGVWGVKRRRKASTTFTAGVAIAVEKSIFLKFCQHYSMRINRLEPLRATPVDKRALCNFATGEVNLAIGIRF